MLDHAHLHSNTFQAVSATRHSIHLRLGPEPLIVVDGVDIDPELGAARQPVAAHNRVCCRLPLQADQRCDWRPIPVIMNMTNLSMPCFMGSFMGSVLHACAPALAACPAAAAGR